MANYKKNWLAIVCAYRKEEYDLSATVDGAGASAGQGVKIITVEDKDLTGPGYNRHRGIDAAIDSEVICIIDAHMRFNGDVIRAMATRVKRDGGLLTPFCHHNAECSFDSKTATGKHFYGGARIVFRAQDGAQKTALAAKWNKEAKAGVCGAVVGACYVFRRDWYYSVGAPLAMLRGWGCDEELLSIASWLSGKSPEVFDGHVAHLYREKTPWSVTQAEREAVAINRRNLIHAFVSDAADRKELNAWNGGQVITPSKECERVRVASLAQKKSWLEWKRLVCEPDEINGVQEMREPLADSPKRTHVQNPIAIRSGIQCPHCGYRSEAHPITNSYPNKRRRHRCETCSKPFISVLFATQ